ncbi:MAG: serine/threonine-protein kinase [Clostridia bacterium]|nr:serine/threonine-protein kinase [Clostridia bacterium]
MEISTGKFVFGDWKVVSQIGKGASGTVYKIEKDNHGALLTAVLKVVHITDSGRESAQSVVDSLIDEIKFMIEVKGFPHVVSCEDYDVVQEGASEWTVLIRMELLQTVSDYQRTHDLTEADIRNMALQLGKALELIEGKSIIHRDIKPENVFINDFGDYKLGDFGIARVFDQNTQNYSAEGTRSYMAPEVYRGEQYDQTVDIYSLGVMLYQFLNRNRLPFLPVEGTFTNMDRQTAFNERIKGKKELPAPVCASEEFGRIVLKMCAYKPEDRYHTAKELLFELEKLAPSDKVVLTAEESRTNDVSRHFSRETDDLDRTDSFGPYKSGSFAVRSENVEKPVWSSAAPEPRQEPAKREPARPISDGKASPAEKPVPAASELPKKDAAAPDGEANAADANGAKTQPDLKTTGALPGRDYKSHLPVDDQKGKKRKSNRYQILIIAGTALVVVLALLIPYLQSRTFSLVVKDGSGSGSYKAGTVVEVRPDNVQGKTFRYWESEGIELSDEDRATAALKIEMPRKKVQLTAVYEAKTHKVEVTNGSGSGVYKVGETVKLSADELNGGVPFSMWSLTEGEVLLADSTQRETSFVMPDRDVSVKAEYKQSKYKVTVTGGKGSGNYSAREKVVIEASAEKDGKTFAGWTVVSGDVEISDPAKLKQIIVMPEGNVEIRAEYK